ncbi:hypothetical protein ABFG93_15475 [Pseudalkalibacillus hwajinpoensis]|uniref:ABC transporter permease n=1 Tax=Guptibacillus hwajinpoensis TaxID=208199 RepID=UPI00325AEE59
MKKWVVQFKLELTFLFKNWFFTPLPFLYLIWLVFSMGAGPEEVNGNLYRTTYETTHALIFILLVGLSILIGVYIIRRDVGNEAFEWHRAFPVSNFVFISAKILSGLIYLSIFTLLMATMYALFANNRGIPNEETISVLSFFIVQYEVAFVVSLSLGMLLSVLIRNRFVYLIAFCAWMFGTLFMEIFIIQRGDLFFLKAFHLTYLFNNSILVNGTWGIELLSEEVKWQRLFVLTFSLLLHTLIMLILNMKRPNQYHKLWKGIAIFSILLGLLSFVPYGQFWDKRVTEFDQVKEQSPFITMENEQDEDIYMKSPPLSHPDGIVVGEGELYNPDRFLVKEFDLKIDNDNDFLTVSAELSLPEDVFQNREELAFTLNRTFEVKAVYIDQCAIPFEQENDFVTISLPDTIHDFSVTLQYEGMYQLWSYHSGQEYYPGFVSDDQLVMPSQTAWYPLPGHQYLFDMYGTSRTDVGLMNRAEFNVSLTGVKSEVFSTIPVISDTPYQFKGETAKLDLYGGDLTEVTSTHYPFSVVTTYYNRNLAEQLIEKLDERMLYTDRYVTKDIQTIRHLFYLPVENIRWTTYFSQQGFIDQNYLLNDTPTFAFNTNHHYFITELLKINLFHEDIGITGNGEGEMVTSVIQSAFNYIYELEHGMLAEANETRSSVVYTGNEISEDDRSAEEKKAIQVYAMIKKAMNQGKEKQVKEVLNRFYSEKWDDPGFANDFNLYHEPSTIITFAEWKAVWNDVMKHNS